MPTKFLASTSTTYILLFSVPQLLEEDHKTSFLISLKTVVTWFLLSNWTGIPQAVVTNNSLTFKPHSVFSVLDPSNLFVAFGLNFYLLPTPSISTMHTQFYFNSLQLSPNLQTLICNSFPESFCILQENMNHLGSTVSFYLCISCISCQLKPQNMSCICPWPISVAQLQVLISHLGSQMALPQIPCWPPGNKSKHVWWCLFTLDEFSLVRWLLPSE